MSSNEYQVGGDHYKNVSGCCPNCGVRLQHWDVVAMFNLDYFQAQVLKYMMRWRQKNGLQDLDKAKHFLEKYIEIARSHEAIFGGEAGPGYVNQD